MVAALNAKSLFASKTFWFNVVTTALYVIDLGDVKSFLSPNNYALLVGIGNAILRYVTKQPVTIAGE